MDPVERQVNKIVKGINGIDPSKLRGINEANRSTGTNTVGGTTNVNANIAANAPQINQTNQAIQQQTRQIIPLNKQWSEYDKVLAKARLSLVGYMTDVNTVSDYFKEYNKHTTQAKVNMSEYSKAVKEL